MEPILTLGQWREEKKKLIECREFLESSRMSTAYHEGAEAFRPFLREALAQYGEERVKMVLGYTARNLEDGRFDKSSMQWASGQPHFPQSGEVGGKSLEPSRFDEFTINKHPTILNQAIRELIKMDKQRDRGGTPR